MLPNRSLPGRIKRELRRRERIQQKWNHVKEEKKGLDKLNKRVRVVLSTKQQSVYKEGTRIKEPGRGTDATNRKSHQEG